MLLQGFHRFLELSPPVLEILEHVEARAGRRQEHHIAQLSLFRCDPHRFLQGSCAHRLGRASERFFHLVRGLADQDQVRRPEHGRMLARLVFPIGHGEQDHARRLADVADLAYPMVLPPDGEDGLGIMVLNSNAATHFSFTNALGMISLAQSKAIDAIAAEYPRAVWIIALHHHVVEYPTPAKALSERIGTALINGSYVVRRLQKLGGRAILMHGHRHTEWVGTAGKLVIVSAPSPVMDATDADDTHFYVHTVSTGDNGRIALLVPERIVLRGLFASDLREHGG